jgi:hypothetical protein
MEPTITPNNPDPQKTRLILIGIGVFAVICIIGLILAFTSHGKKGADGNTSASPSPEASASPGVADEGTLPPEIIPLVTAFAQARENAVGVDQPTPTSWISAVQSIITPKFLAQLQPPTDGTAGSASGEFNIAHDNGYVVKATLDNCNWDLERTKPTATSGSVFCNLTDTTINKATGAAASEGTIPFGWSHTGTQLPLIVEVVKQNGKWLINTDVSGEYE